MRKLINTINWGFVGGWMLTIIFILACWLAVIDVAIRIVRGLRG